MLEPDGYTPLFNPTEFPEGSAPWPILGYIKGKYATYDSLTATLNPFVAYGIDLPRRVFIAGTSESRTVLINTPSLPLEFGYAVDASWFPVDEVNDPVEDFPIEANCLEPYKIEFESFGEMTNTIGCSSPVSANVFDHQGFAAISTVSLECPSLFNGELVLDFSNQTGDESWEYTGTLVNEIGASPGDVPLLLKVSSVYGDPNLGILDAYQVVSVEIKDDRIWAKRAGGEEKDRGYAITRLSDDSTVVIGSFEAIATFGEGEPNETSLVPYDFNATNLFIAKYYPNGMLVWAKKATGASTRGYAVTALSDDSVVVTGEYYLLALFGAGEVNETTLTGGNPLFVARYNSDGTLAWAKDAGPGGGEGSGIIALADGSTIVAGKFWHTVIFGEGEPNETTLEGPNAYSDAFLAKYNQDGLLVWAKEVAGGDFAQNCNSISLLTDNSTVVTGSFLGLTTFGEGEPNEITFDSVGYGHNAFIARHNIDGTLAWVERAGGTHGVVGNGITALSDNSTVITGRFQEFATFGLGEPNEVILESSGEGDVFIARYNPDGTIVWAKGAGGVESDRGIGITVLSDDSTVVAGLFNETAIFGEGEPNETTLQTDSHGVFVAKYNFDGTLEWAKHANESSSDDDRGYGITALSDDSMVVTGGFSDDSTFWEGEPNGTTLHSAGSLDIFICRFLP